MVCPLERINCCQRVRSERTCELPRQSARAAAQIQRMTSSLSRPEEIAKQIGGVRPATANVGFGRSLIGHRPAGLKHRSCLEAEGQGLRRSTSCGGWARTISLRCEEQCLPR